MIEMDELIRVYQNVLNQLKHKSHKSQVLIGSCAGLLAAITSMRIAKSVAFIIGGSVLLLSVTTDFVWNPRFESFELNLKLAEGLVKNNTSLAVGFVCGYLLGFSIV